MNTVTRARWRKVACRKELQINKLFLNFMKGIRNSIGLTSREAKKPVAVRIIEHLPKSNSRDQKMK